MVRRRKGLVRDVLHLLQQIWFPHHDHHTVLGCCSHWHSVEYYWPIVQKTPPTTSPPPTPPPPPLMFMVHFGKGGWERLFVINSGNAIGNWTGKRKERQTQARNIILSCVLTQYH